MLDDGYAAVTSRRVGREAAVNPALVHYYFPTLDDLLIAVFRRRSEWNMARLEEGLRGGQPLHAIWRYATDRTGVALTEEFLALGNHRKAIQAELGEVAGRFRKVQLEVLQQAWLRYGIDREEFPPEAAVVLMSAIPRVLVSEEALGLTAGHPETRSLVQRYLQGLEGDAAPEEGSPVPKKSQGRTSKRMPPPPR